MARPSARTTAASGARSTSKRPAPEKATPTRQSKRSRTTPAKHTYAEPDSNEDENDKSTSSDEGNEDDSGSDFSDGDAEDPTPESPSEVTDSDDNVTTPQTSGRGQRAKHAKQISLPVHKKKSKEKELWEPGSRLEVGTQVIIKKPKAREAGDTPYTDHSIHPNTMLFLRDIAANNDRQWLKLHDPDYRMALQDFNSFLEKLTDQITSIDETIPELPVKDIIFRIYRDVRFSKDQTPYKTHFSAAWSRTGRKGPYAAYYVQVKPGGGSFVGGGLWQPEANALSLIRRDIDRKPHKIKRVLNNPGVRKAFFGGIGDGEKKAVEAFVNQSSNKETALKNHPKGYEKDHKDIELLRLRSFTLGTRLPDHEIVGAKGLDRIVQLVGDMVPFITYLNSVVMPDEETDDSDDSNGEEDEEDEDVEADD
ncbi:hypothetical protein BU24DRAFT_345166 [Aaosphaeria arxii CBS 175.79]|uniref:Uncharacterized protein n=1 Tax=Aaosphaeria arxii CBS 175.79 TaxID=1450172 RepID=A0A6A5XXH7_9PLEO|nr:uncharacterized protein BU24DRAFT_345166 [Aaosphaeria arxii CBS 175.79]KAF2017431.1 hypothetical protein BU24DRAFT_345166 [Aaosphaeria arxii CBS 175.79]